MDEKSSLQSGAVCSTMWGMRKGEKGIGVRLPESLFDAVKRIADKERRSFNAQLTMIVEEWLREHPEK